MASADFAQTQPRPYFVAGSLDYLRSYKFLFSSPNWLANWARMTVCLLIPCVGQIVVYGYAYGQMEKWLRRGHDAEYEDFQFDRFVEYLTRGLWPFLIECMQVLVLFPLVIGFILAATLSLQSAAPGQPPDVLRVGLLYGGMDAEIAVLSFLMTFIITPMMLRSGLAREFKVGLSIRFVSAFLKRTRGLLIASIVVQCIAMLLLMLGGALVLCIGALFTCTLAMVARFHFQYQLYVIYLARGGEPIPLKESKTPFMQPLVYLPVPTLTVS